MQINWTIKPFTQLNISELYDLMHLRQLVFVVEQDAAYLDADFKDQKSIHVLGYHNEALVAYSRVIEPGVSYSEACIGRVVNNPNYRRNGIGKTLMAKTIDVLEKYYKTSICRISAQTYLLPFYKEYGFEVCSEEYLEDGLPHHEMIRK